MEKTLSALPGALLALGLGLLGACGGDAVPILTASSPLVDFGEVAVGETSSATLRVSNDGTAEAEVGLPSISGDDAAFFAVVDAEWPMTLAAGATAEIALGFTPTASGVRTAEIELSGVLSGALSGGADSAAAGNSSLVVALLGIGSEGGDDDDSAGDDDDSAGDDDDDTGDDDDDTGSNGVDDDGDGYIEGDGDCDDGDPTVNANAAELCDAIDHNCDGDPEAGAGDATTWFRDLDGDGYGDDAESLIACSAPVNYSAYGGDCNDADPVFHPGATEIDCTDPEDYNCDGQVGYADGDGDGHPACEDCDDGDAAINSAATESCDGADDDCDGQVDESGATGEATWYLDGDSDGYGRTSPSVLACAQPAGYVANANDCDDLDPGTYPGASEVCDEVDNNCDGVVDEGAAAPLSWFADADGDSFGNAAVSVTACAAPFGTVADSTDCDDLDASSFPGGTEVCDGADNNCDTVVDEGVTSTYFIDGDGDGYGDPGTVVLACSQPAGASDNSLDCDDGNAATNPTSYEICDGVDNNCAGGIDEAGALDANDWYLDADGDGFGTAGTPVSACTQPTGYADNDEDCDDDPTTGPSVNPNASELCNNVDDDCDGTPDDGAVDAVLWYDDADGDGYGNPGTGSLACAQVGSSVQNDTDCNDTELSIHPLAPELCDGVDNDCDGGVDEGDALGTDNNCAGVTCKDILDGHSSTPSDGTYWIDPDGSGAFQVYCDMFGGGWTYESVGVPFRIGYTGASVTITAPTINTEYDFSLYGASDGGGPNNSPSGGGLAFGRKVFTAGTNIHVYVGGQGDTAGGADQGPCNTRTGGFNGGGLGSQGGAGGGGATDIRTTLGDLNSRLLVAAGAGGCGYESCNFLGGAGGGLTGGDAVDSTSRTCGDGASQSAGGVNPTNGSANGAFGVGGDSVQCNDEGGGGGGWYGGTAGGLDNCGGSGGSSYVDGMDDATGTTAGVNTGNGYADYIFR